MRNLIFLLLLIPNIFFAQTRNIKGHINFIIKDTCSGKINFNDIDGENVKIYLIDYNTHKGYLITESDNFGNFDFEIDSMFTKLNAIRLRKNTLDTIIQIKNNDFLSIQCQYSPPITKISDEIQVRVVKPAIYLYPIKNEKIDIKLDFKGELGTTFPKYNMGWSVEAKPNGELINLADNRKYNYLFWEGDNSFPQSHFDYKNGFVINNTEAEQFLIDELSNLGLNNTEINDFIVYWLPQLEKNEYNLIHFFVNDNIDNSAFLDVKPKPDTQIRVFMEFKAVDKNFKITKQELPRIERKGFTLVEWGGGIIGSGKIE